MSRNLNELLMIRSLQWIKMTSTLSCCGGSSYIGMLVVDVDDQNSRLALVDHQVKICLQQNESYKHYDQGLVSVLKTRECVYLHCKNLVFMYVRA